MSRVVVLKLHAQSFLAAVIRDAGAIVVEAAARGQFDDPSDAKAQGQAIAAALGARLPAHAATVVAIPRSELYWQNIDLPPAPADDLPDLVHLQAQRDLPIPDDGAGFDFVPLEGDDVHPHRVVGVGVLPDQLERIRTLCEAAELKLQSVVPEPFGWPELGRRLAARADGLTVFAAIADRQATIWAAEPDALRLMRSVRLPEDANFDDRLAVLGGELRRTLLALSNVRPGGQPAIGCVYCGEHAQAASQQLSALLNREIRAAQLDEVVDYAAAADAASATELAPLAALGASLAARRQPLADLLHPRRRPAPPSRRRTYALAGAAAALLALLVGWRGYRNVAEPREIAAAADAQRNAMAPQLEAFAKDEQKAAAIQSWLDESINVLSELDYLSQRLRPLPLDSADFKVDEDLVVTKFTVTNRQMALEAAAKSNQALPPAEQRLRAANYELDRGAVNPDSKIVPGYGVGVSALLQRVAPTEPEPAAQTAPDAGGAP